MDYISYTYAIIVFGGGFMGYLKVGSVMSLMSGVAFGGLLGYGAWQMSQDTRNFWFSLGVSLLLMSLMGVRFFISGKIMPAGLVTALSLGQALRLSLRYQQ